MTKKRLFRQEHPILTGLLILGGIFVFFWAGMTFFISMLGRPEEAELFISGKGSIGVIEVKGVIVSPEETVKNLVNFQRNDNIKAVVLRIDSPGGAVGASQEIFEEVKRTNTKKPVIASMGSIAASGGYYAALGSEKIFASPGTLTGSIGVIIKFANLKGLFEKIGYEGEVVKSGKMKDIGAPDRPLTPEERALLQTIIDNVHDQFVRAVAEGRKLPLEKVKKFADGRIFSGEQAKEQGLIDQFGNFRDAVIEAAKLAGLETEKPHLVYPREKDFSLFKILSGERTESLADYVFNAYPVLSYEWRVF